MYMQIFLNVVVSALSTLHWGAVSGLFVVIGLIMFLIPVVPGPLVYLASGVLIVPVCEAAWGGENEIGAGCLSTTGNGSVSAGSSAGSGEGGDLTPFFLACLWASSISYALKLIAHVLQQKCIGETLQKSVYVRSLVSPNSRLMKALRVLLEQPGVTPAKVCVMCGGPDWPTSVLCGLLRLSCCQALAGLTPMFIVVSVSSPPAHPSRAPIPHPPLRHAAIMPHACIVYTCIHAYMHTWQTIPTTLTGAFATKATPEAIPNSVAFLLAIVLIVQVVLGVGCLVFARYVCMHVLIVQVVLGVACLVYARYVCMHILIVQVVLGVACLVYPRSAMHMSA